VKPLVEEIEPLVGVGLVGVREAAVLVERVVKRGVPTPVPEAHRRLPDGFDLGDEQLFVDRQRLVEDGLDGEERALADLWDRLAEVVDHRDVDPWIRLLDRERRQQARISPADDDHIFDPVAHLFHLTKAPILPLVLS